MSSISIRIVNDLSDKILSEMKQRVHTALDSVGAECETYAIKDCPVDTGTLRNSITHKVNDGERKVYIGTNVKYGVYVEYGDYSHTVGKKHFLRDAAANHADHYREILKAALF